MISNINHFHLFPGSGGGKKGFQNEPPANPAPSLADKVRARKALNHAVGAGRIARQPCEQCNAPKAEAHHDDYSKPLSVRWLCPRCHSQLHKQKHPLTKTCVICETVFTPHPTKRERAKTCSPECHALRQRQMHGRLTIAQTREIHRRYSAGGITQQALADEFECDRTRISQIVRGKTSRIQEINYAI